MEWNFPYMVRTPSIQLRPRCLVCSKFKVDMWGGGTLQRRLSYWRLCCVIAVGRDQDKMGQPHRFPHRRGFQQNLDHQSVEWEG